MRTIKFRGKGVNTGKWFYGSTATYGGKAFLLNVGRLLRIDQVDVIPDTVGQYTCLVDNEGRDIFEGDIIFHEGSTFGGVVQWHPNGYFFINDSYGKKYPRCNSYRALGDMLEGKFFIVKGNIHDNPEMIEKGGEE